MSAKCFLQAKASDVVFMAHIVQKSKAGKQMVAKRNPQKKSGCISQNAFHWLREIRFRWPMMMNGVVGSKSVSLKKRERLVALVESVTICTSSKYGERFFPVNNAKYI